MPHVDHLDQAGAQNVVLRQEQALLAFISGVSKLRVSAPTIRRYCILDTLQISAVGDTSNTDHPCSDGRFNIEDTHITNPDKLATLLVIVALAMTWAYRCASRAMGRQGILKKAHKRRVKSWFRIGFDMLRRWILYDTEKALQAWRQTCPKRSLSNPNSSGIMP